MTFERDARTALADGQLRGALRQATTLFGERRRAALSTVPDWEGARDRARAIKDETLEHLIATSSSSRRTPSAPAHGCIGRAMQPRRATSSARSPSGVAPGRW